MAIVRFSKPAEFLDELKQDKEVIGRGIVRITNLFRVSKMSPIIHHLSVMATAKVEKDIIRLESYCGDLWDVADHDKEAKEDAEQIFHEIEQGCRELGLQVRAGVFEERDQAKD